MSEPKQDAPPVPPVEAEPTCGASMAVGDGRTVECVLKPLHGGRCHAGADGSTWLARSLLFGRRGRR